MQGWLTREGASLVKLAGWFCLHEATQTLGYWQSTNKTNEHQIFGGTEPPARKQDQFTDNAYRSFILGYGFSYVFTKSAWGGAPFENRDVGEDSKFAEDLIAKGHKVHLVNDADGLCLHVIHKYNTSRCFPNYILPHFCLQHYFSDFCSIRAAHSNQEASATPTRQWDSGAPQVTICTLTYNRSRFLPLLQLCIERQDYPLDKIEWLVLDDSDEYEEALRLQSSYPIRIKYQRLKKKLKLGAKRNLAHKLCSGDFIVYMDDDDYYLPSRVSHAVATLIDQKAEIAGSTYLPIYFTHDQQLWQIGRAHV